MNSSSDTPPIDAMSLRLAAANALIRRRRSIKPKDMDDRSVDPRLVAAVLENANWAPTHGMTEPWRFFLFTDAGRERLADFCQSLYRRITPEAGFRQDKFDKLRANPLKAPVTIAIAMKRQEIEKIPEIEEIESVACAVHNMHLTASALGLAGFWATPPLVYTDEMRQWLGLSDPRDKCLGFFHLGWPSSETWPEGTRGDLSEKVVHVMK